MKALVLLLFASLGLTGDAVDLDVHWHLYKGKYNKLYETAEHEQFRRSVWEQHLQFIEKHNREAARGEHTFLVAVNQFADMPNSEFQRLMKCLHTRKANRTSTKTLKFSSEAIVTLPQTVDWREKGYVTAVKDQGQCGSCWAFAATGSLEGQWFKKTGDLISLSEQNLVDCSKDGNLGCEGGFMEQAFLYIRDNEGIDTEESYPYEAQDGECRFLRQFVGATDTGYEEVEPFSELDLQAAVATIGPIAVAIDASHTSFQLYSSGVYFERSCSSTLLSHAVLTVGYGSLDEEDYWLAKNSWGTSWGQDGYIFMARNRDNNCGIASEASYPTV